MSDLHLTVGGFVAQQQPNVNAAYGPWTTLEEARIFLERTFLSILDGVYVPKIPVGTTVAVYTNGAQTAICEYWWINNDLTPKTYGGSQYLLELLDSEDKNVTSISINEGYSNTPKYIKARLIDMATKLSATIGSILFSIDGGPFEQYEPNSITYRSGIPTAEVTLSLVIECRDDDKSLLAYQDVAVHHLPDIIQSFFAYNNDELTAPEVAAYIITNSSYLGFDWTPNEYGLKIWNSIQSGVTTKNHVEWKVTRSRTNGVWSDLQGPFISARWGHDGIVAVDRLTLYYYSETLVTERLDDYFEASLDYLEHHVPEDKTLDLDYKITDEIVKFTWLAKYESPDPYTHRYCYVTQRFKGLVESEYVFGDWTIPALYSNFAVDGKDGDDVEYIYSKSTSELLSSQALAELDTINANYTSTEGNANSGGEIPFKTNTYWTDDPSGVTLTTPYEFCARRYKTKDAFGNTVYLAFGKPFMWASFGKEGPDGPGLEYIYILTKDSSVKPVVDCSSPDLNGKTKNDDEYLPKNGSEYWLDDPVTTTSALSTLWMSLRKGKQGKWKDFTDPIIWNQFSYTYELKLLNDNCSIPADPTGKYTLETALKATATKVELWLGLEKIDLKKEGITIECDDYACKDESFYLNKIIPIDNAHFSLFKAKNKEGKIIAQKSLTVTLAKGKNNYSLMCFPNSRIWYGGDEYSNTEFTIAVYTLDDKGIYRELDENELLDFRIKYQVATLATISEVHDIHDKKFVINAASHDSDVYIMLYNENGELLDTEVIDAVDYSKIRGKDHSGISIDINDQVNIPKNKINDRNFIKEFTRTKIVAYKNLKIIPIERIEVSAVDVSNPLLNSVNIAREKDNNDQYTNTYYVDLNLVGDLIITYSIFIKVDGEEVLYDKVLNVNISLDLMVYELRPNITNLVYNPYSGPNVNQILFDIVTNDDSIPEGHWIEYRLEGNDQIKGVFYDNTFEFSNDAILYLKGATTTQVFTFSLYIPGIEGATDHESISIWPLPKLDGYNYTIDLSNPSLQIPKGFDNDEMKTWTENTITVYLSGQRLQPKEKVNRAPYFEVNQTDVQGVIIKPGDGYYTTYFTTDMSYDTTEVHYDIIVHETSDSSVTLYKSLTLVFTDDTEYSLFSNPSQVVLNPRETRTIEYNPTIKKGHNGKITNVTSLATENLKIIFGGTTYTSLPISYTISADAVGAIPVELRSKTTGELFDSDDFSVVRNGEKGEDGIAVEYVYGRANTANTIIDLNTLNTNGITGKTKETFKSGEVIGGIKWTDDPQGIDENHLQEFISVSKYEKTNGTFAWSKFSTPKVHALFGKKGEDGNGIEYIYTACKELYTLADATGGFTVTEAAYTYNNILIEGSTTTSLNDEVVLSGWFDNIPDLNLDYPNLYMTYRKKLNGSWGYFAEPVLWNKYSTSLELILDNDLVIIDDNSDATTIKNISTTHVTLFHKGVPYTDYSALSVSISNEINTFLLIELNLNTFHLTPIPNTTLSQQVSGQITYTFTLGKETITRKQTIHIKNFSAGEAYKLILTPNAIPLKTNDNGYYTWDSGLEVHITILKIKGPVSLAIEDLKIDGLTLYVKKLDNSEEGTGFIYKIPDPPSGGSLKLPSFDILLKKSNVLLDSQTLTFSTKGADGKTPIIVNLTDDSDALFVDADTTGPQSLDTNVLVFFNGADITNNASIGLTLPDTFNSDEISVAFKGKTIIATITLDYYSDVENSLKISIPIIVTVNYDNTITTLTVYYHINIFKNFLRRELYPSINTIKVDKDGKYSDESMTIKVREFKDGKETIDTIVNSTEPGKLSILVSKDGKDFNPLIGSDCTINDLSDIKSYIKFKLIQDQIELDLETIPVVKDGTDGKNGDPGAPGINGKNASLRMAGEWNSSKTYYCEQEDKNVLYTDVVAYRGDDKLLFYFAKVTNTGKIPPDYPLLWEPVLYSELTLTLLLLIYNAEAGSISGGFVDVEKQQSNGTTTSDGIILWAGGSGDDELISAQSATFSVTRSGVIRAKEGLFEGMYASKMKVFDTMPLVETLPFIPEITYYDEQYWADNMVDFNKLTETSHFKDKVPGNTSFNLELKTGNLQVNTESEATIYLPSGFMLPKYTADEAKGYVQALYALSLIEPTTGNFDGIFSSRSTDGHDFYSDTPAEITENINTKLSITTGGILNTYLINWLLKQKNTTITSIGKTTTIEKLLGDTNFAELLYLYHRTQFLNALPYVGKTFTFINAPEIKGLRGFVRKSDDYYVPANQIESEYNSDLQQGINIMHETLPTLYELGHYIAIKDWPRYNLEYVGDAYDMYQNSHGTDISIYNDTKLISVLCKLIPLDIDKRIAYIGWDVVSGPFNKQGAVDSEEQVPNLKFPSII